MNSWPEGCKNKDLDCKKKKKKKKQGQNFLYLFTHFKHILFIWLCQVLVQHAESLIVEWELLVAACGI